MMPDEGMQGGHCFFVPLVLFGGARLGCLGHLVDAVPYNADLKETDEDAGGSEDICGGDKAAGCVRNGCLRDVCDGGWCCVGEEHFGRWCIPVGVRFQEERGGPRPGRTRSRAAVLPWP